MPGPPPDPTVGDYVCFQAVQIPAWFTAAQALRIAELKGVDHLLVEQRGRAAGVVARRELALAPPDDPVARWTRGAGAWVAATAPAEEAWRFLESQALECAPVLSGGMLVGTVARAELARLFDGLAGRRAA
jgi:predicted transcriptional regulator